MQKYHVKRKDDNEQTKSSAEGTERERVQAQDRAGLEAKQDIHKRLREPCKGIGMQLRRTVVEGRQRAERDDEEERRAPQG